MTAGYEKRLEIQGVGYRAALKGKNLELAVGYSHPVPIPAPDGIEFEVPQPTRVVVKGISKQLVGETAAIIRKQRPPEPYKGKGIRYEGEYVQRKVESAHERHHEGEAAGSNGAARVRAKVSGTAERPRISVFRSNRGVSAQLIDDVAGRTLAAVNWFEPELRKLTTKPTAPSAPASCSPSAAKAAGISEAVFDRGGYRYHGHVRAFAEAIREAGITV